MFHPVSLLVHFGFGNRSQLTATRQQRALVVENIKPVPPTTLPPVLSRASTYGPNLDGQEVYERGVSAAFSEFEKPDSSLKKVILA
jgi:hypothetical protein